MRGRSQRANVLHNPVFFIALVIIATALILHFGVSRPREEQARRALLRTAERKVMPLTRHPQIDPLRCLRCLACISACPEADAQGSPLALVHGRIELVDPAKCVGHGECEAACPTGALTVGLGELAHEGTIPELSDENESAVPGIFVAGELSGMPLIRNAIAQGKAAVDAIAARTRAAEPRIAGPGAKGSAASEVHDVLIVGLGPAGFAASLAAHEAGLRYLAIDQGDLGGTVVNYPRQKLILTQPVELPVYGRVDQRELSKEGLLAIWRSAAEKVDLRARYREKVASIERGEGDVFRVTTNAATYLGRHVIVAVGRRGTPRKLGVPGEGRTKVAYSLVDANLYRGKRILIVGGGDSAVEAALALAHENSVTISYRRDAFFRVRPKNAERIRESIEAGRVAAFFESEVAGIGETHVAIRSGEERFSIENDLVFVLIGGEPPFDLLRAAGVLPPPAEVSPSSSDAAAA